MPPAKATRDYLPAAGFSHPSPRWQRRAPSLQQQTRGFRTNRVMLQAQPEADEYLDGGHKAQKK